MSKRGMSIAFAVFTLLVLSVLAAAIFSMLSTDVTTAGEMARGMKAFYAAEASKEIGAMAVRDDKLATGSPTIPPTFNLTNPAANGYCGVSFLDGGYSNCWNASHVQTATRAAFHGTNWTDATPYAATMQGFQGAYLALWNFQQRYNLIGSKLLRVRMVAKVRKLSAGDPNARLLMQYSIDGGVLWAPDISGDLTGFVFDVTNSTWPADASGFYYSGGASGDTLPGVGWQEIMNQNNFRIRLYRLDTNLNNIEIDWFALEVVTEVDASTEPWGTHSYISLPASLGDGVIQDIAIQDEAGKINLNNAPRLVMKYLFRFCGMSGTDASNLATAISNYRVNNKLDTIEELKSGLNVSEANFGLIRNYVTVYSWRFPNIVALPPGAEPPSPVNINTASENVLKAIIKCADLGNDARVTQVAKGIIAQRAAAPFINIFSSYESQSINGARDLQTFSGFLWSLTYPWLDDNMRRRIMDVADISSANRDINQNWWMPAITDAVHFCCSSHTFEIISEGRAGNLSRTVCATYGNLYNYSPLSFSWNTKGTFYLPTYIGDSNPQGYWRERLR